MWQSLPDTAIDFINDVGREYGSFLFDYAKTEIGAPRAGQVVADALVSAAVHATRLGDLDDLRPWLYGVLRAHRSAASDVASTGSWARPGQDPELDLLASGLAGLQRPQRELLDLVHRHGLSLTEVGLIFDAGSVEVGIVVDDAAAKLEGWFAAIAAARIARGCPELETLVTAWERAPSRLTRTQISHHILGCAACQAAPRERSAAELLRCLPVEPAPEDLADHLAAAEPLGEGAWRPDGFPVQEGTLADLAPPEPDARQPRAFRDWDRGGRREVDEEDEEVWASRADESDPEARISPIWLITHVRRLAPAGRAVLVASSVLAVVLVVAFAWSGAQAPPARVASLDAPSSLSGSFAVPGTATDQSAGTPQGTPLSNLAIPPATIATGTLPPATVPARATVPADTLDDPPGTPTGEVRRPTTTPAPAPTGRATPRASSGSGQPVRKTGPDDPPQPTAKAAIKRVADQPSARQLPRPAVPEASLSPSTLSLGDARTGTFSLSCPGASCQVSSASASSGVSVSGNTVSVSAKAPLQGCTYTVETGTVTVSWTGVAEGDGTTTKGTTNGSGTLTLTVSYKAGDPATGGYRVYDGSSINNSGGKC